MSISLALSSSMRAMMSIDALLISSLTAVECTASFTSSSVFCSSLFARSSLSTTADA